MITAGLSLEQAPPFNVPLRFFLTAPPFLLLAAGLLLWQGPDLFASRWLPATLALTHLLTLGFMAQVMAARASAALKRGRSKVAPPARPPGTAPPG